MSKVTEKDIKDREKKLEDELFGKKHDPNHPDHYENCNAVGN